MKPELKAFSRLSRCDSDCSKKEDRCEGSEGGASFVSESTGMIVTEKGDQKSPGKGVWSFVEVAGHGNSVALV